MSAVPGPTVPCNRCGRPRPLLAPWPWCDCGGAPAVPLPLPAAPLSDRQGLWRWQRALPLPAGAEPVSLGEGRVPVEPLALPGLPDGVLALREDLEPTGSWKDRGSTVLVTAMKIAGVAEAVEDSSGNAALSLARYARAAGIRLRTFVPAGATRLKKELIAAAGAEVVEVPGPRRAATGAAREAAARGASWASHAAQPLHALGAATAALDLAAVLPREAPGTVIVPAGQGGLLAGLRAGFEALVRDGHLARLPRLVGVQSAACAPLAAAWSGEAPGAAPCRPGLAEGVLVEEPARAPEALAAARASGGTIAAVDDLALERALRLLWREGRRVEPTAALPVAWLLAGGARELAAGGADGPLVVVLTGHGVRAGRSLVRDLA